jgi:hypothetical protein
MSQHVVELYGIPTSREDTDWAEVALQEHCPFLNRRCVKIRKSEPDLTIGTCVVRHGVRESRDIVICPHRLLNHGQVFIDCLHLLTLHEPGNALHRLSEIDIPGGSVDYFLVSTFNGKVVDFVGIELQSLDTTGTIWPARQAFLQSVGLLKKTRVDFRPFGMNWKMTAKTTLLQMHHKVETFQGLGKHLVLVLQDVVLDYMQQAFNFGHIQAAKIGHPMHFHAYQFGTADDMYSLQLASRLSTDTEGVTTALGLQASADVELEALLETLQSKISPDTLLTI